MRKIITWIAEDGEEFPTEEECYAHEHRFDYANDAAVFLDDEFNVLFPFDLETVYDKFIYIVIRDEEKAHDLFWAIHDWERCFEMPKDYHAGDILKWDGNDEVYVDLKKKLSEIGEEIASIEKAVSAG